VKEKKTVFVSSLGDVGADQTKDSNQRREACGKLLFLFRTNSFQILGKKDEVTHTQVMQGDKKESRKDGKNSDKRLLTWPQWHGFWRKPENLIAAYAEKERYRR